MTNDYVPGDRDNGKGAQPPLAFNGREIHTRGEYLNLTDMWKAAGSDDSRRPANWARKEGAPFIEAVAMSLNVPVGHIYKGERGKHSPGTQAHWQIGLAYAKYLSPEFHMWCNTVVRERMEGGALTDEASQLARRTDGIARMLAHKVTGIERDVGDIGKAVIETAQTVASLTDRVSGLLLAADSRVAALEYVSVRELLNEAGALSKGRRSLNSRVGFELRTRALLKVPPIPLRRCPHSGVWLFPRDYVAVFMAENGKAMVSDHNAKTAGQGVLKFPDRRRKPKGDQPGAGSDQP